jgi:hypothetical protein
MTDKPPISETIKAKLEELEVEQRLEELVSEVSELVAHGVNRAGEIVHDHRDDITAFLDRAAALVDRGFDHKQTARVDSLRGQLERGVDRIAEHRLPPATDSAEPWAESTDSPAAGPSTPPTEPPSPEPPSPEPPTGSAE